MSAVLASHGPVRAPAERVSFLIAAWWLAVASTGMFVVVFGRDLLPQKFGYDATVIRALLGLSDLWDGMSYDGFVNTARAWWLVIAVLPEAVAVPFFYGVMIALAIHFLGVRDVRSPSYHLIAAAWLVCTAPFLTQLSKEMVALPAALFLCLARSHGAKFAAALLFLFYAAFFRQYWFICYFYFVAVSVAFRLYLADRNRLALVVLLVAYAAPFVLANAIDLDPLTYARTWVNSDRVDSPDARSAFNNTFAATGFLSDFGNAVVAWFYMNLPVALLTEGTPHYIFFAAFQIVSLRYFAAGCASFLRDAKRIRHAGSVYFRSAAFVVAYSLTQSIFEPDFGSFLRHEVILMIPMLIVIFYRAHQRPAIPTIAIGARP